MTQTATPPPELEERLESLERQVTRFRVMFLLLLALGVGTPLVFLLWPRSEISATSFVVRDAGGQVRGILGLTGGGVALTLRDSAGQMRADVGVAKDGTPSVLLLTAQGVPVVALNLQSDGAPFLRLTAPDNTHRIWLRTGHRFGPLLGLLGADSAVAGFVLSEGPSLLLRDSDGIARR